MRTFVGLFVVVAALFIIAACRATPRPTAPVYRTTTTVKEIMGSMVEPSANALWNAVATNVTDSGSDVKAPKDEYPNKKAA